MEWPSFKHWGEKARIEKRSQISIWQRLIDLGLSLKVLDYSLPDPVRRRTCNNELFLTTGMRPWHNETHEDVWYQESDKRVVGEFDKARADKGSILGNFVAQLSTIIVLVVASGGVYSLVQLGRPGWAVIFGAIAFILLALGITMIALIYARDKRERGFKQLKARESMASRDAGQSAVKGNSTDLRPDHESIAAVCESLGSLPAQLSTMFYIGSLSLLGPVSGVAALLMMGWTEWIVAVGVGGTVIVGVTIWFMEEAKINTLAGAKSWSRRFWRIWLPSLALNAFPELGQYRNVKERTKVPLILQDSWDSYQELSTFKAKPEEMVELYALILRAKHPKWKLAKVAKEASKRYRQKLAKSEAEKQAKDLAKAALAAALQSELTERPLVTGE